MAFTVGDFRDLIELLAQHPEWRAELRRQVLSDEILELPALVRQLVEAQSRTEAAVADLAAAQARTEAQIERVEAAIERLTEAQARTEARMDGFDARMDRLEAQMGRFETQMAASTHDRAVSTASCTRWTSSTGERPTSVRSRVACKSCIRSRWRTCSMTRWTKAG